MTRFEGTHIRGDIKEGVTVRILWSTETQKQWLEDINFDCYELVKKSRPSNADGQMTFVLVDTDD